MQVTSRQIMDELGIKNIKTLTRWYQAGLIPPPEVEQHPDGVGRIACWPAWVKQHCKAIKRLTHEGHPIKEIHALFGDDWPKIASRYLRYDLASVSAEMDEDASVRELAEIIDQQVLSHLMQIREKLHAATIPAVLSNVVRQALDVLSDRQNPVLVLSEDRVVAVPDVAVSAYLSKFYKTSNPMLVVPLYAILSQQGSEHWKLKKPVVKPGPVAAAKKGQLAKVSVKANWDYQVEQDN